MTTLATLKTYNVETYEGKGIEVVVAANCVVTNSGALAFVDDMNITVTGFAPDQWKRFWKVVPQ